MLFRSIALRGLHLSTDRPSTALLQIAIRSFSNGDRSMCPRRSWKRRRSSSHFMPARRCPGALQASQSKGACEQDAKQVWRSPGGKQRRTVKLADLSPSSSSCLANQQLTELGLCPKVAGTAADSPAVEVASGTAWPSYRLGVGAQASPEAARARAQSSGVETR